MTIEQQIEAELASLLNVAQARFSTTDLEQVREFVEHDECGLALETIAWMFIEAGTPMPGDAKALVRRAAALLKLEESEPIVRVLAD